jgi:hypothetical protein
VPVPFAVPEAWVPANVVTFPPDTTRIMLLPASATYNVLPLTATPAATENLAPLATVPLAKPGATPATVDTVPPVAKAWSDPIASDMPSDTAVNFPICFHRRRTIRKRKFISTYSLRAECQPCVTLASPTFLRRSYGPGRAFWLRRSQTPLLANSERLRRVFPLWPSAHEPIR